MRLIDADALDMYERLKSYYGDAWRDAQEEIDNAPTVDAVPVIRCKDCKWYYRGGATCMYWYGANNMCSDDFCSRAERRSDDSD